MGCLQTENQTVFKIESGNVWQAATASAVYRGSADDHRDGFIHLSTGAQLSGTYEKHFRDRAQAREALVLIAFHTAPFKTNLKWEASRGGQLFPHVYGAIATDLALWVRPIIVEDGGRIAAFEDLS